MNEWGDLDERLEHKKRMKLRRQQRELKKQQKQLDALEKERQKVVRRCAEMAHEDALSVAMMRFYHHQERQKRREIQRENEMVVYAETAKVRRRAKELGLPLQTPGMSGKDRLAELNKRIETKEAALETAIEAKKRLDALPKKRSRVRRLLEAFFSSSTRAKLEQAVYASQCEAIAEILDPKIPGKRNDSELLNHESQNGLTPVLCTIYQSKLTLLRKLLDLGASPDYETKTGMTPLLACVLVDNVVALHILVEFHVNLSYETKNGVKALWFAADRGRNTLLKALLRLGVTVDNANTDQRTPLLQAVISGHYETTKILIAFNASKAAVDASGRTALDWAQQLKFDHIAALLSANVSSRTLLAIIDEQDHRIMDAPNHLVQEVIKAQSKVPGTIAMEAALEDGNVDRILELLSVNDPGYGPNYETSTGATPMLVVSEKGSSRDVLYCLERGSSVIHCNRQGVTPLMKAAYHGRSEVLQLLIRAGCSLWSKDIQGRDAMRVLHDNDHQDLMTNLITMCPTLEPRHMCLSQPVEITALRSWLSTQKSNDDNFDQGKASNQPQSDESEQSDNHGDNDTPYHKAQGDLDITHELTKTRQWKVRRRTLRSDTKRNLSFEAERQKVWKYAERGRRNGLIAPLPFDKAGRFKFPPCDNCHGNRARKRCFLCDQVQCDRCHSRLHELHHRRHHDYEELEPTLMVGAKSVEEAIANQEESLQGTIDRSISYLATIKQTLVSLPVPVTRPDTDFEVEKNQRKERAKREKEIAQMQINVPVSAAKHAIQAGEGDIYVNPTEIELADLYITQGKLAKARALMEAIRQTTEESLGSLHPTILKIQLRLARIEQHSGDLSRGLEIVRLVLGNFESTVAPDNKDLINTQDLGLQILDALADYASAVVICERIYRLRVVGLSRSHRLVEQAVNNLDMFIAKREKALMYVEDLLLLGQTAMSAECAERLRVEQERKLASFRSMLLDQVPSDLYASYMSFAKKEFADEMVQFWIAVEAAKTRIDEHDAKTFRSAVVSIFVTYVKSRRVKIITAVQRKRMKKMITTPGKKLPRTIFDDVQALVFDVIYNRMYTRFLEAAR